MSKLFRKFLLVVTPALSFILHIGPAGAQDSSPSNHPLLKPYNDWVSGNVAGEFVRYWRIYPVGDGREPYVVYCKDELFAEDAIRGKSVRVRARSEAAAFFSDLTGKTAVLLPSSEINVAFELDIIDCIGFGGELVEARAPASNPKPSDEGDNSIANAKDAAPAAASDSLMTLPQNLDDF